MYVGIKSNASNRPLRDIQKIFSDSCRLFTGAWLQAIHRSVNEAQTTNKTVLAFGRTAKGYVNKELVDALGISLSTVKEYKSEVMYKLRLGSLAELSSLARNFSDS
jgi:FixJ family two-component response regulator